jgi:hypothetical protein
LNVRYLRLTVLTLLSTVVVSMCFRLVNDPGSQRAQRGVLDQQALDRVLNDPRIRESAPAYHVPNPPPEIAPPRDLPPAIEQLRMLEIEARSMILY